MFVLVVCLGGLKIVIEGNKRGRIGSLKLLLGNVIHPGKCSWSCYTFFSLTSLFIQTLSTHSKTLFSTIIYCHPPSLFTPIHFYVWVTLHRPLSCSPIIEKSFQV